jgi:hypothetical protein
VLDPAHFTRHTRHKHRTIQGKERPAHRGASRGASFGHFLCLLQPLAISIPLHLAGLRHGHPEGVARRSLGPLGKAFGLF